VTMLDSDEKDALEGGGGLAPELRNIRFFDEHYKTAAREGKSSPSAHCSYNGTIAQSRGCNKLAKMWNILASLAELGEDSSLRQEVFESTVEVLVERANAGDVQSCVFIWEVFSGFKEEEKEKGKEEEEKGVGSAVSAATTATAASNPQTDASVPKSSTTLSRLGITSDLSREWYFSYLDILRSLCLFTSATSLIKSCPDDTIAQLSKQSTDIYSSCPTCLKPLLTQAKDPFGAMRDSSSTASAGRSPRGPVNAVHRACPSCRKKVGACSICHAPIKGLFASCVSCGHGTCLPCGVLWFRGEDGMGGEDRCPTGCGHLCSTFEKKGNAGWNQFPFAFTGEKKE